MYQYPSVELSSGWSYSIRRWCCGRLRVAILGQTHPCRLAGRSLFAPDARTKPHTALAWPNRGTDPGKLTTISRPAISLHLRQLALLPFSQLFLILCFTLFFGRLDQSTLISQLLSRLLSSLLSSGSSIYLHPLFNHHARSISFYRPPLVLCSTRLARKTSIDLERILEALANTIFIPSNCHVNVADVSLFDFDFKIAVYILRSINLYKNLFISDILRPDRLHSIPNPPSNSQELLFRIIHSLESTSRGSRDFVN
jgi:hypothetical protein